MATHGIGADSTIQLKPLLRGGGGNQKRNKDGRAATSTPAKMSQVTTAFRALHLIQQQDREKREEEEDKVAGVESGMGLSEERRKRTAKEATKVKQQTLEGKQREADTLHNFEASALLEEIQQASENLPKLPEEINVSKIRHLVQQQDAGIELVELASRAWFQVRSTENTDKMSRSRLLKVGTMTRPEGDRYHLTLEAKNMDATTTQTKVENWFQGFNPSVKSTIDSLGTITEARDENNNYFTSPKSFRISTPALPPALLDLLFKDDIIMIGGEEFY